MNVCDCCTLPYSSEKFHDQYVTLLFFDVWIKLIKLYVCKVPYGQVPVKWKAKEYGLQKIHRLLFVTACERKREMFKEEFDCIHGMCFYLAKFCSITYRFEWLSSVSTRTLFVFDRSIYWAFKRFVWSINIDHLNVPKFAIKYGDFEW